MKRRLLIVSIFLLAGAIVNVGVASGIVIKLEKYDIDMALYDAVELDDPKALEWWGDHAPRGFARRADRVLISSPAIGASVLIASAGSNSDAPNGQGVPRREEVGRLRVGWPMRSMEGVGWHDCSDQVHYQRAFEFGDFSGANLQVFPLGPLWPGFLINTLFYATLLWLLICGPFALRRHLRVRRGRCAKCGYPRSESGVCTECGAALGARATV